eukprot:Lithocolla_globosa_v1_NODE_4434_length_1435_cov_23.335507.p1 type:complete len:355 gc:universal NODE_4434_length_1435_cov_23.335507:152-1216(+)
MAFSKPDLSIFEAVFCRQATEEVKLHAMYGIQHLNKEGKEIAHIYGKSESAISKWKTQLNECESLARKTPERASKLKAHHRQWIIDYVTKDPLQFIHELCDSFYRLFRIDVSCSTVAMILHEAGFTKQVIERHAMEISTKEIIRFAEEINTLDALSLVQLLFIDEMSTDNRSMLRKRGWFLRGHRPVFRSFFQRSNRISCLTFLSVEGIVENFITAGTFDRLKIFKYCRKLLDSGKIEKYPGRNSVWILDGASIHLDSDMISYFRSRGIKIIFLPAYCPFFNPIEILFGFVKTECQRLYRQPGTEKEILCYILNNFATFDASAIFRHCGYMGYYFTPHTNYDLFISYVSEENEK